MVNSSRYVDYEVFVFFVITIYNESRFVLSIIGSRMFICYGEFSSEDMSLLEIFLMLKNAMVLPWSSSTAFFFCFTGISWV